MDLTRQSIALPATRSRPCTGKVGHVRLATHSGEKYANIRKPAVATSLCRSRARPELDESPLQVLVEARSSHDEMLFNGPVLGG